MSVLTVKPPSGLTVNDSERPYLVKRSSVIRDKNGYVRGYIQYLSFDLPLFFRLLFGPKYDLVISEPPPTTGAFVRVATFLRRSSYAYYAADIWSDASAQTGVASIVVRAVRMMELFALKGACAVLSVSDGVTERLANFGVTKTVKTIGNGISIGAFQSSTGYSAVQAKAPVFLYAGTASEWHGADIFVDALPAVLRAHPDARLVFVGGGSERDSLKLHAERLGIADSVVFEKVRTPETLAPDLCAATAAIASVRPGAGYDFAFPTKLYSAAACGAPLLYTGIGPAADFVQTRVDGIALGWSVDFEQEAVSAAMISAIESPFDISRRARVAEWAAENVSLDAVAARAVAALEATRD